MWRISQKEPVLRNLLIRSVRIEGRRKMKTARFLFLRRSSGEQIGNPPFLQPINAMVFAEDILFRRSGGQEEGLTFAPGGERYLTPSISDIPGGGTGEISVVDLAASNRFPF